MSLSRRGRTGSIPAPAAAEASCLGGEPPRRHVTPGSHSGSAADAVGLSVRRAPTTIGSTTSDVMTTTVPPAEVVASLDKAAEEATEPSRPSSAGWPTGARRNLLACRAIGKAR